MALGRGLSELLGEIETAYDNNNGASIPNIISVDVDLIKSNPYQPRKIFNEEKLKELSASIKNTDYFNQLFLQEMVKVLY